jgi:Cof subfamily protein (haloacid dehalogenase superfamily)
MDQPRPEVHARLARVRLVLMDIDGTLVTADKTSFENVVHQLKKLKPLNIRFSVATGRTIDGARAVVERLKSVGMRLPPIIHYNGGVLLSGDDRSVLQKHAMSPEAFGRAVRLCRTLGLRPSAYACRERLGAEPLEVVYAERERAPGFEFNGMTTTIVDDLSVVSEDFVALLAEAPTGVDAEGLAREMGRALGAELRASCSGGRHLEICHPEGTKRSAMEALARSYGIVPEEIMAIGDNLNDAEMIRAAGVGVAVANAPDSVKAEARYVCTRSNAEGVVEALRLLVTVRRRANDIESPEWTNPDPSMHDRSRTSLLTAF